MAVKKPKNQMERPKKRKDYFGTFSDQYLNNNEN